MQHAVQDFLHAIFSRAGDGYLRVIEVKPGYDVLEDAWNNAVHNYFAVRDGKVIVPESASAESEWYFNPALLRKPEGRGKKENIHQAAVLWVDIDTVGINPFDIQPHPSIIVSRSSNQCRKPRSLQSTGILWDPWS